MPTDIPRDRVQQLVAEGAQGRFLRDLTFKMKSRFLGMWRPNSRCQRSGRHGMTRSRKRTGQW